jgi:hypothetical protein
MLRCSHREPLLPASRYVGEHRPSLSPLRDLSPFHGVRYLCRSRIKLPGSSLANWHTHEITVPRLLSSSQCHGAAWSHTPSSTEQRLGSTRSFPKQTYMACRQAGGRGICGVSRRSQKREARGKSTDPWRVSSPHTNSKSYIQQHHRFNRQ